jgi:chaperone BCS1
MGLGIGATFLKTSSLFLIQQMQKRYLTTLEIPSKDSSYLWMLQWLSRPQTVKPLPGWLNWVKPPPPHVLSVDTKVIRHDNGSASTSVSFVPGIGKYYFQYKGAWIQVERSRDAKLIDLSSGKPWENISLTMLTRDRTLLSEMLDEARRDALAKEDGKTVIYTSYGPQWRPFGNPRRRRLLASVFLDQGIRESLYQDVKAFLENSSWYYDRGIPYRRGYLLYGPPGTGKTSFIQALAGELEYNICLMNLSERGMTDDRLAHLLTHTPPRSLILLEDVDAAFASRQADPKFDSMLTFSGLLNALDGVASGEERLVFMTTNHVDRLDPALIRPGRVDVKQYIGHATDQQIMDMFCRFYASHDKVNDLAQEFLKTIQRPISTAQLQGHFVMYRESPLLAIEHTSRLQ